MSLSARIMNLPHHASSRTDHWLDYAEGHHDARRAAAELAAEADAIRDELVSALEAMTSHAATFNRDTDDMWRGIRDMARAAIARAKGQA